MQTQSLQLDAKKIEIINSENVFYKKQAEEIQKENENLKKEIDLMKQEVLQTKKNIEDFSEFQIKVFNDIHNLKQQIENQNENNSQILLKIEKEIMDLKSNFDEPKKINEEMIDSIKKELDDLKQNFGLLIEHIKQPQNESQNQPKDVNKFIQIQNESSKFVMPKNMNKFVFNQEDFNSNNESIESTESYNIASNNKNIKSNNLIKPKIKKISKVEDINHSALNINSFNDITQDSFIITEQTKNRVVKQQETKSNLFDNKDIQQEQLTEFVELLDSSDLISTKDFHYLATWFNLTIFEKLKLKLLYRGSQNQFKASKFHEQVKNIDKTITFVRSWDYDKIFGGYTSIQWQKSGGFVQDKQAFIFSLTHKQKFTPKNVDCAVYHGQDYLPSFGNDISILNDCNTDEVNICNFPEDYNCDIQLNDKQQYLTGGSMFQVDEIEVFQVIMDASMDI